MAEDGNSIRTKHVLSSLDMTSFLTQTFLSRHAFGIYTNIWVYDYLLFLKSCAYFNDTKKLTTKALHQFLKKYVIILGLSKKKKKKKISS